MTDIKSDLIALREFLTEDRWTTEVFARAKNGRPIDPQSEAACKWCVLGACQKLFAEKGIYEEIANNLDAASPIGDVIYENDDGGYSCVIDVIDRAIEAQK